ncbi:MAG: putative DNA-binding domain-containing protein [Methylobacter sp.]|nr:putative DNA-binding domain-containing protein [Methylobacter sp.]MDP2097510.1 putative DNA-binding domain-containing protein [Methylobacter sp.]MDP2429351.1 putative DNA-binding domain-containing protein [Methylobacter sp.]MDP3053776.1 putative DNA-binding domain-containing protein [Methylobacter sp.]MDP3362759.1 putative DNA-binding domain-containing protein [Methylobacter sp.]
MMAFQAVQRQFLAHLRNPGQQPLPTGFDPQGVALYTDLLYNKFNDSLTTCFPVTQAILGEKAWQQLLKSFIARHRCLSPYYRQIPDEFIQYLQTEWVNHTGLPYLLELAHFEWVELILAITDAEPVVQYETAVNDWSACHPVFAPVLQLLHYAYPVQHINENYHATMPPEQATPILGFRDKEDAVQFIELNPATARLIEILHDTDDSYTVGEAIEQIAAELQHPEPSALFAFGVATLADLMQQGAILGAGKD